MSSGDVYISVRGGATDRPEVQLKAGTPADAFSVGSAGSWKVSGPGVAPTHGYLYFDGTTLFVACAPGAIVQLGGEAVSTDWKVVTIPAEIRVGGVTLAVAASSAAQPPGRSAPARPAASQRPRARPQPSAQKPAPAVQHVPPHAPPRSHSGGDGGHRAPAMSPVAGTIPYDDEDVPTAYQPVPEGFSVEHDAATQVQPGLEPEPMADSERTRVVPPPEEKKAKPERPAPPSVSPASGESATVVQPLEEFLANARAQQSAPHHAAPEMPPAAGAPPGMMPPAAGSPAPQGAVGVYVQPPEPTVPAMGPASAYAAGLMPGGQGQPQWQQTPGGVGPGAVPPGAAPQGAPPGPKGSPVDDIKVKIETAWRDASPVRRVLFFLMPLMIVALIAHVLLTARRNRLAAEYAAAQASASALLASASAAPSASAPPTASAVPTVAPPSTPSSAPPQPPENPPEVEKPPEEKLAKGEVTDERKAVDAVARGDLDKAIELYSALAKAHPDEPAYAAAVEILQKKKGAR